MSEPTPALAQALRRLSAAADALDAAALRRAAGEQTEQTRALELELMRKDRARLTDLLDQAVARGRALEAAKAEAEARIDRAEAMVRQALGQDGA